MTSAPTGTGSGTVTVSVPPNAGVEILTYTVLIGGSTSTITVAIRTRASIRSRTEQASRYRPDALRYSIQINANQNGCPWNASTDQPGWLTLSNPNSNGTGTLDYSVTLNNTGVDRVAHITIGGQQLTVTQDFTSAEFADVPPSASLLRRGEPDVPSGRDHRVRRGRHEPTTRAYCPNDNVTREEMAAFIVRAVTGTTTPAIYNMVPYFTDVPDDAIRSSRTSRSWMTLGITAGCATGLFCPTDNVPRWEMAIFMVRARLAFTGRRSPPPQRPISGTCQRTWRATASRSRSSNALTRNM